MLELFASCIEANVEDIENYDATETLVTLQTFRKYFDNDDFYKLSKMFDYEVDARYGLTMRNDWHVKFGHGFFKGEHVLCLHHSAIHYFFRYSQLRDPCHPKPYITTELGLEKYCPKCEEHYPATKEFFFGKRADSEALESCCKACYMERKQGYKGAEKTWGLKRHFANLTVAA
jgi:hypothetical protein